MKNRELLELAAKAAGLSGYIHEWIKGPEFIVPGVNPVTWNPLTDDGDALRLASKLRLRIYDFDNWIAVSYPGGESKEIEEEARSYYTDEARLSMLRLAITRAAAAIQQAKEAA